MDIRRINLRQTFHHLQNSRQFVNVVADLFIADLETSQMGYVLYILSGQCHGVATDYHCGGRRVMIHPQLPKIALVARVRSTFPG